MLCWQRRGDVKEWREKIRRGGGMQLRRMGITDGFYDGDHDANIDTLHKAKISTPVPKQAENKNHTYKSLLFPL